MPMIEAFKVASELALDVNPTLTGIKAVREALVLLRRELSAPLEMSGLKAMADQLSKLKVDAGLKSDLSGLNTNAGGIARSMEAAAAAMANMAKSSQGVRMPGGAAPSAPGGVPAAPGGVAPAPAAPASSLFHEATGIYFSLKMAQQGIAAVANPARQLQIARSYLTTQGMTPGQIDAAQNAALDTQRGVKGTDLTDNMLLQRRLMALTQNADDARQLMPAFAKIGAQLAANSPEGGDYLKQLEDVMSSAEFRGDLVTRGADGQEHIDLKRAAQWAKLSGAVTFATGGQIGSHDVLQFLRSAGAAGANLDESDLPYVLPLIQSMKAANAGTGLKGFNQQFSAGRMSEAAVHLLEEQGIITDPSKVEKAGLGQYRLKPGAMADGAFEMASFHPVEFFTQAILPHLRDYMVKQYPNFAKLSTQQQTDAVYRTEQAYLASGAIQDASRIPGGTFMAELIRTGVLGQRDAASVAKQLTGNSAEAGTAANPDVQIKAFTASLTALAAVLGDKPFSGALIMLGGLTTTLNALGKATQDHPTVAGDVAQAGSWVAVLAAMRAVIAGGKGIATKVGIEAAPKVAGALNPLADLATMLGIALAKPDYGKGYHAGGFPGMYVPVQDGYHLNGFGMQVKDGPGSSAEKPIFVQPVGTANVNVANVAQVGQAASRAATSTMTRALSAPPTSGAADSGRTLPAHAAQTTQ